MPRFDLLDEYTCVLLPGQARKEANRPADCPATSPANRRTIAPWGHWMAVAGGFAALVIAATGFRLPG
jgi:hypothetical protein